MSQKTIVSGSEFMYAKLYCCFLEAVKNDSFNLKSI